MVRSVVHLSSVPPVSLYDIQEPECCDGSDEQPGVCPNVCREVGEAYRKQQEAERKIRRTVCMHHVMQCRLGLAENCRGPKYDLFTLRMHRKRRNGLKTRLLLLRRKSRLGRKKWHV